MLLANGEGGGGGTLTLSDSLYDLRSNLLFYYLFILGLQSEAGVGKKITYVGSQNGNILIE